MGCRHLRELFSGVSSPMTSSDLSLWMAYYKVEAEDEEKAMKKGGPKSEKQPASQLKHSLTAFGQKQGSSK